MLMRAMFLQLLLAQETGGQPFSIKLRPLLEDHGIPLAIMGMLVVFAALVFVSLFILLLPRILAASARKATPEKAHVAVAQKTEVELSPEILVVIAAAVAQVISEPHRIIRTRELTPEELGWSLEGRLQHHASHNIRQRDRH